MTFTVIEPGEGDYQIKILVYQLEHVTKKDGWGELKVSFSHPCFLDHR